MTVVCSGGASEPKPGFSETVWVGTASITAMLNNIPIKWAAVLAGFIAYVQYDLADFCTVDPPAEPSFTAADALAILNPLDINSPAAYNKLQDLIGRYFWYQFCQCSSVATPAPPTPPATPVDFPTILDTPITAMPCGVVLGGPDVVVSTDQLDLIGNDGPPIVSVPVPAGTIRLTNHYGVTGTPISGHNYGYLTVYYDDSNTGTGYDYSYSHPAGDEWSETYTLPAGTTRFRVEATGPSDGNYALVRAEFFCSPVGSTTVPCCPPDPVLTGLIGQLARELALLRQDVTLIQRQAAPFAYVPGDSHPGITGSGEIEVEQLIGMAIAVTDNDPGRTGIEEGHPEYLFGIGWFNWGSDDGFAKRQFVQATDVVSFPPVGGVYTKFAYSLAPGVEVTLTELVREP